MSDPNGPGAGHNNSPVDTLLAETRKSLRAHSRQSKGAIEELHKFFKGVLETCEYARKSTENTKAVKLALFEAGVEPPDEGNWLRPIIAASFQTKKEREAEKTNISKWTLAIANVERNGVIAAGVLDWLKDKSIAKLASAERTERRKERDREAKPPKADPAFEAVIEKHRKPIELPGVELGDRFGVLVIERGPDGRLCQVAYATAEPKEVRRYFPELA